MKKTRFNDVLLFVATVGWGASFFVVKDIVATINPFVLVAYRFLSAAVVMGIIAVCLKRNIFANFKEGFILGLLLWGVCVLEAVGMVYTTASNSGLITGLFVVFVPLFSMFLFRKKTNRATFFAIVIDILGLWFLTEGLRVLNIGDFLILLSAAVGAFQILYVDIYGKRGLDSLTLCVQQFFITGVLSLLTALIFGYSFTIKSSSTVLAISFLIAIPTLFSFVVQIFIQKHINPVRASLIYTLEPVFAATMAWTIGGEKIIPIRALGGFLIFLGMIVSDVPWHKLKKLT